MDEPSEIQKTQNESAEQSPKSLPDSDWFLEILVKWANGKDGNTLVGTGITLSLKGLLVSGSLIGYREYFEGIASLAEKSNGNSEMVGFVADTIRGIAEKISKFDMPVEYIHLKDAHFYLGGNKEIPANAGVYWRGRLSEIDGFTIGLLSQAG